MSKISVIIPNYNGIKYLKNCIESLYENTQKDTFRLIVVDNGSTDGNYNFVRDFNNAKLILLEKNYGFSYAVNVGIKNSDTEFIVLLNNDTIVQKDWLKALFDCISSDDKIFSACSMMIRMREPDTIDDAGDNYNIFGWGYKRYDGKNINTPGANLQKCVFSSCAGSAIYRKSILDKIGCFDEHFFAYLEDMDLSYRALTAGCKNVYCPASKLYHIGSATSGSKYNDFKVKLSARNNIFLIYKNMPILQLIINLPFLFVGTIIKYIFFINKGYGKVYMEGIKEGFNKLKIVKKNVFHIKNLPNYIKIEFLLIKNLFSYVINYLTGH